MKLLLKTWRLLDYSLTDPKMNLAVNEAIFRSRREGLTPDTLRLWQGPNSVVLGTRDSYRDDVNHEACQRYSINIARASSVVCGVLYQDRGSLNFTVAANTTFLKDLIGDYQPVMSEYQILNECIAKGLQRFGVDVKVLPSGVYIDNRKVFEALPFWFYDFLLFQGTLRVNTNLDVYYEVIKTKNRERRDALTSLNRELGREIQMGEVKTALVKGVEERLGVRFEEQGLTKDEQKLIKKLYDVKYGLTQWNVNAHKPPFLIGMGKTAVEVFVAYPPTSMCREIIRLVNEVVSDLQVQDEVKVMIWMRGKGIYQHGPYPEMSDALRAAEKSNIIPAIIINGELKFRQSVPSKETLRKAILDAL